MTAHRTDRRRAAVAAVVLVAVWTGAAALLWLVLGYDSGVIPVRYVAPGFVAMLLFGIALLASRRWEVVWRRAFVPTVPVPGWCWIAGGLFGIGAVALSSVGDLSVESLPWLAALSAGGSYGGVVLARRDSLRRPLRWPSWTLLAAGVTLATVVSAGALFDGGTALTVVFVVALVLAGFNVTFLLPLALYQALREGEPPADRDGADDLPAVSVLIPAYEEEGVVGECVESVLASAYPTEKLEVVVVDDGSSDGTYEEAAAYRDRGVQVLRRSNGGKYAALNMALQCTSSPVVATVDADSRPTPSALPAMVRQLRASPEVGALSSVVLARHPDSPLLGAIQRLEYALSNTLRRAFSVFGAVPVVPGCLGVYRREALEDVQEFDPDTITEDFDVTVQLLRAGWEVSHGAGVVWTIPPGGVHALWAQRVRWYRGGFETLRKHADALTRPRHRYLHSLVLPTLLVSHVFWLASVTILGAVLWALATGPSTVLLVLLAGFFVLTVLVALFVVLLEDEPLRSVALAPLLFAGYTHFIDVAVGVGTIRAFFPDRRW